MANIVILTTVYGIVAVPCQAFAAWLNRDADSRFYSVIGRMVADPKLFTDYFSLTADPHARVNWLSIVLLPIWLVGYSFADAGVAIASAAACKGERPNFSRSLAGALRVWPAVAGTNLLLSILSVAVLVPALVLARPIAASYVATPVITAVLFAATVPLWSYAATAAALDSKRPGRAVRDGWLMATVRGMRLRTLAIGAGFITLFSFEVLISDAVVGVFMNATHAPIASFIADGIFSLLTGLLNSVLMVVLYLDARNRIDLLQEAPAARENSQRQ